MRHRGMAQRPKGLWGKGGFAQTREGGVPAAYRKEYGVIPLATGVRKNNWGNDMGNSQSRRREGKSARNNTPKSKEMGIGSSAN